MSRRSAGGVVAVYQSLRTRNSRRRVGVWVCGAVALVLTLALFGVFMERLLQERALQRSLLDVVLNPFAPALAEFYALEVVFVILIIMTCVMTVMSALAMSQSLEELGRLDTVGVIDKLNDASKGTSAALALRETLMKVSRGGHSDVVRRTLEKAAEIPVPGSNSVPTNADVAALEPEIANRTLLQLLAQAILYSGVVGTFFGLFMAFSGKEITKAVSVLTGPGVGTQDTSLNGVIAGFAVAFACSLFSYVASLLARAQLALVDAAANDMIQFLEHDVSGVIHRAAAQVASEAKPAPAAPVAPLQPVPPPQPIFMGPSPGIPGATTPVLGAADNAAVKKALDEIVGELKQLRTFMAQERERYDYLKQFLTTGRESWEAAAKTWTDASDKLQTSAKGIGDVASTFNESWRQATAAYLTASADSANKFMDTMNRLREAVADHVNDLEAVREVNRDAAAENHRGRAILAAAIEESQRQMTQAQGSLQGAVTTLTQSADGRARELAAQIAEMQKTLATVPGILQRMEPTLVSSSGAMRNLIAELVELVRSGSNEAGR